MSHTQHLAHENKSVIYKTTSTRDISFIKQAKINNWSSLGPRPTVEEVTKWHSSHKRKYTIVQLIISYPTYTLDSNILITTLGSANYNEYKIVTEIC